MRKLFIFIGIIAFFTITICEVDANNGGRRGRHKKCAVYEAKGHRGRHCKAIDYASINYGGRGRHRKG